MQLGWSRAEAVLGWPDTVGTALGTGGRRGTARGGDEPLSMEGKGRGEVLA